MGTNRTAIRIELSGEERAELERLARSHAVAHRTVIRALIVLALAGGQSISAVSRMLRRRREIVRKWAKRFREKRLAGLIDEPRSGRPLVFSPSGGYSSGKAGVRAT